MGRRGSGSERVRGREMQRDVSGPMERLHHRDRMQTASPPPPRVLIEYAKSLLRAPPILVDALVQRSRDMHSNGVASFILTVHFMPNNFFPRIRERKNPSSSPFSSFEQEIRIRITQTSSHLESSLFYMFNFRAMNILYKIKRL